MLEREKTEEFLRNFITIIFILPSLLCYGSVQAFNVDIDNPLIVKGRSDSYFGYSVALLKHNQEQPRLFVGAPKHNQEGMLFNCETQPGGPCTEINTLFDNIIYNGSPDEKYWLGGTIVTNYRNDKLVVCAHRFTIVLGGKPSMLGACFELSHPFKTQKNLICQGESRRNNVYYFGYAVFGTSFTYSKDQDTMLAGIPGLYLGKGGFVIYNQNTLAINCTIVDYANADKHKVQPEDDYQYQMVGYSITSGRYFNQRVHTVVGGPGISTSGLGKVFLYSGETLFQFYSGTQFGGAFGSSLATADVTGDGNDDLIVGAPMQTDKKNEGRVHVFISTGLGLFRRIVLTGDNVVNAHFGTTVASLGDINMDGYEDVVVGAPYEANCGAIYIYYGNAFSVDQERKQKILGTEVSSELKGFGISFSKPIDVDGNGYNDFAVGAFLSDQAVLLYTRKIIKTNNTISSNPTMLNSLKTSCFGAGCLNLTLCINLLGDEFNNVDVFIELKVDVEQEEKDKRVSSSGELNKRKILRQQKEECTTFQLETLHTNNYFDPVIMQFIVVYNITAGLYNITPVQNILDSKILRHEIPFLRDCGHDNVCDADLETYRLWVDEKASDNTLLIGGSHTFNITSTIRNNREPAYQSVSILHYPTYINHISTNDCLEKEHSWDNVSINMVQCKLKDPLRKVYTFVMKFEIAKDRLQFGNFILNFTVSSKSNDLCNHNDNFLLDVKMRKKATLIVTPISEPPYIVVGEEKENPVKNVEHTYKIYNNGPSNLISCKFTIFIFKIIQDQKNIIKNPTYTTKQKSLNITCPQKFKETTDSFQLTCQTGTLSKGVSFDLVLQMEINTKFSAEVLPTVKSNLTLLKVSNDQYVNGIVVPDTTYQVTTKLQLRKKQVEAWIIILGVILGLIFLFVIIFVLYKRGFFKRQKAPLARGVSGKMLQEPLPVPPDTDMIEISS